MKRICWAGLVISALVAPALGQANFVETFDANGPVNPGQYGPASLIAKGWIFRMQSSP
ncbi:MAG: hypothetical protein H7145_07855, partial [Akkermansiaceae bacterium]|nr:hypothetical protein [Armatimonadota bacterium]